MQEQRFGELEEKSAGRLMDISAALYRKQAEQVIKEELAEMKEQDKILIVSDEEERLIRCFRKFKARNSKPGVVFKWQTHPDAGIVAPAEDGALIVDPQDANQ